MHMQLRHHRSHQRQQEWDRRNILIIQINYQFASWDLLRQPKPSSYSGSHSGGHAKVLIFVYHLRTSEECGCSSHHVRCKWMWDDDISSNLRSWSCGTWAQLCDIFSTWPIDIQLLFLYTSYIRKNFWSPRAFPVHMKADNTPFVRKGLPEVTIMSVSWMALYVLTHDIASVCILHGIFNFCTAGQWACNCCFLGQSRV